MLAIAAAEALLGDICLIIMAFIFLATAHQE
jgi:hypothetical protein